MAGRPRSEESDKILQRLKTVPREAGISVDALARELAIAKDRAHDVVKHLAKTGAIRPVRRVALPGIRKPVWHYASAPPADPLPSIFDLLSRGLRAREGC